MHPGTDIVDMRISRPYSSAGYTQLVPWQVHPSIVLCLPQYQSQSHPELHHLEAWNLIGLQESYSTGSLQLLCMV